MKKLLLLLLLSPLSYSVPTDETQKYLWNNKVSLLTFGLYRCTSEIQKEKDIMNKDLYPYLYGASAQCSYNYDLDKIIVSVSVDDLRGLYNSYGEDSFITEVYKTGNMSLDKVLKGCQKVNWDLTALRWTLSDSAFLHPFQDFFSNKGMVIADSEKPRKEHVIDMFKVVIRLNTTDYTNGAKGYTCEADAKDKKYKLGTLEDEYNFAIKKEDRAEFFDRM